MNRTDAIRLLKQKKEEACADGISRFVEINGKLVALISVHSCRDRDAEQLLDKDEVYTNVAFVHLSEAGVALVGRRWGGG